MEGDRFLMAAGVTAAVVVGAYVLWGPSGGTKLRKRRGQIGGLHNLGRTCFLNAVIQALASCPQFKIWLQNYPRRDPKSLISTISNVIEVVNGTHLTIRSDPFTPGEIFQALVSLGWFIPPDEQDALELLQVILMSLEEETNKPNQRKIGCLSDALGLTEYNLLPTRPSSAMQMTHTEKGLPWPETPDTAPQSPPYPPLSMYTRSEVHTPNSPQSPDAELDFDSQINLFEVAASSSSSGRQSRPRYTTGRPLNKRSSLSCRSLERVGSNVRMSLWDEAPRETAIPPPFRGSLATQMRCTKCGHKTAVRYDKFDTISLHLLNDMTGCTLAQLLRKFIAPEIVKDVECAGCNPLTDDDSNNPNNSITSNEEITPGVEKKLYAAGDHNHVENDTTKSKSNDESTENSDIASSTEATPRQTNRSTCIKSLFFGKLPNVLCLHIPRTMWLDTGSTYKRMDYVSFPEVLSLTPFTYLQASQAQSSPSCTMSSSMPSSVPLSLASGDLRSPYRLVAVIVHMGDTNTGHFITYRRGVMRNTHRWFFTSDANVREVTLDEVLQSAAYMLFYEKCI